MASYDAPLAAATMLDPRVHPTITVEETGRVLKISRGAAYEAARNGQIPTIRIGRRLLVPTAALRRMLALEEVAEPASDAG